LSSLYSGIHAREWISPATVSYFIQQLVEVPANAKLLQNVDWYIMPVMNPDGIITNLRYISRYTNSSAILGIGCT
jgi:murein tripeptide amidase MpaA